MINVNEDQKTDNWIMNTDGALHGLSLQFGELYRLIKEQRKDIDDLKAKVKVLKND